MTTHIVKIEADLSKVSKIVTDTESKLYNIGVEVDINNLMVTICKDIITQAASDCDPEEGDTLDFGDPNTQAFLAQVPQVELEEDLYDVLCWDVEFVNF